MYNWQQADWPYFTYKEDLIPSLEMDFIVQTGAAKGQLEGLSLTQKNEALVDLLVIEAIKTSEIEGEFLSRPDVMSSIKKNLGISEKAPRQVKDQRAKGIGQLMVTIQKTFHQPLTEEMLFSWHRMLMSGSKGITKGAWRYHKAPMQVVSGTIGKEVIHFEAPPSERIPEEMKAYISWFNNTAPDGSTPIKNPLIRSGLAHLYFESIHPFEDGNGRIGRAISEKALSQGVKQPVLLSLSSTMEKHHKKYYNAIKQGQQSNDTTEWLSYFIKTVLAAQGEALKHISFTLMKAKLFDHHGKDLNARQVKVLNRMLAEGPKGFKGGMTAKKYMSLTKASKATVTRDLQQLELLSILKSSGGGRSVSYQVNTSN